jgi:hypothetical protein
MTQTALDSSGSPNPARPNAVTVALGQRVPVIIVALRG